MTGTTIPNSVIPAIQQLQVSKQLNAGTSTGNAALQNKRGPGLHLSQESLPFDDRDDDSKLCHPGHTTAASLKTAGRRDLDQVCCDDFLPSQFRKQIFPLRIPFLDQLIFPIPPPPLNRFFSPNCRFHRFVVLIPDQGVNVIRRCMRWDEIVFVLPNSL
jgi:hypothetical protein